MLAQTTKTIIQYLTRENILAVISILAFIMSLTSWIAIIVLNRRSINIEIYSYKSDKVNYIFYILITNNSRLAIPITHISMQIEKSIYDFPLIAAFSMNKEKSDKSGMYQLKYDALSFPINMPPLSAIGGPLIFEDSKNQINEFPEIITFLFYSCSERPIRKKFIVKKRNNRYEW